MRGSALNEQGGGGGVYPATAGLRLGRGGIFTPWRACSASGHPTPPFRLALALDADGICANEVGAPPILVISLNACLDYFIIVLIICRISCLWFLDGLVLN